MEGSKERRRAWWLRQVRRWHWISAAVSLAGLLLFSITGITLNHASSIEARPSVSSREASLPAGLLESVASESERGSRKAPLPGELRDWLAQTLEINVPDRDAEWSAEEVYLDLPRPGGDAWLRIEVDGGQVEYESTSRGWISYLNDLHKGRHAGTAWSWYIDVLAAACLVFAATGLFLLQQYAGGRPATWPLVAFSALLPALLAILFIH